MLDRRDEGGVAVLTLADPGRLNALSDAMLAALSDALAALAADGAARAVVLAAEGRAFCAGHDLREMQAARQAEDGGRGAWADLFARCAAVMQALGALPQPVIAAVHAPAVAAGCQLVASCDVAVAGPAARFGVNGIDLGLYCSTPVVALSRAIPPRAAFEMAATGRLIDAEEARALGLVTRVAADPLAAALETARAVAAKPPRAVALGKRAFRAQAGLPLAEAYAAMGAAMVENMGLPETDEGIDAFLGKRPPRWEA